MSVSADDTAAAAVARLWIDFISGRRRAGGQASSRGQRGVASSRRVRSDAGLIAPASLGPRLGRVPDPLRAANDLIAYTAADIRPYYP